MSRTLIVGDVHACSRELKSLIDKVKPTEIILVGDLFTKGPNPAGVWKLIQNYNMRSVLGNHDAWLLKILDGEVKPRHRHLQVVDILNAQAPGWAQWLRELPLFIHLKDFTIVHAGIHPSGSLADTSQEMAILMRHWPLGDLSAPHWHEKYEGSKGVIFGHDARGGLIYKQKNGRGFIIGLDSGCVYGKKLSGYLLETDELYQVTAAQVYQPIYCV